MYLLIDLKSKKVIKEFSDFYRAVEFLEVEFLNNIDAYDIKYKRQTTLRSLSK